MKFLTFPHLLWNAKRAARHFGAGMLGAALIFVGTGIATLTILRPAQVEVRGMQLKMGNARAQAHTLNAQPNQGTVGSMDQLTEFYRIFPARATNPDAMAKLYAAAAQHNIELEHGDYRLIKHVDDQLTRYEIVLPVRGGYIAIRKFAIQALAEIPTLALDGVVFNRQKVDEPAVDAELRFTLYLGKE